MDQETLAKIQRSKDEIEPRLNFLRDDKYLNPETPIMKKPGRQNFFQDFYVEEIIYHIVGKWDKPELKCYMLIPKNLDVGQSILFHVLWHGGGLVSTLRFLRDVVMLIVRIRQPEAAIMSTGGATTNSTLQLKRTRLCSFQCIA